MTESKECFKCKKVKPLDEFYPHRKMADGRLGKCKDCARIDVANNYALKRGYYSKYEARRAQKPERKAKALDYQKTRRKNNPDRALAYTKVYHALRRGHLLRQPCEVCGSAISEAHHEDYSRPLDVVWLCREHHLRRHGKVAYTNKEATMTFQEAKDLLKKMADGRACSITFTLMVHSDGKERPQIQLYIADTPSSFCTSAVRTYEVAFTELSMLLAGRSLDDMAADQAPVEVAA